MIYSLQQPGKMKENNSCSAELSNCSPRFRNAEEGSIVDSQPKHEKGKKQTHPDICYLNYLRPCSMQARCDFMSVRLLCSAAAERSTMLAGTEAGVKLQPASREESCGEQE